MIVPKAIESEVTTTEEEQQPNVEEVYNHIQAEAVRQLRKFKAQLRSLSKRELIALVLQQTTIAVEQQNINKLLLDENKNLKAQRGENKEVAGE